MNIWKKAWRNETNFVFDITRINLYIFNLSIILVTDWVIPPPPSSLGNLVAVHKGTASCSLKEHTTRGLFTVRLPVLLSLYSIFDQQCGTKSPQHSIELEKLNKLGESIFRWNINRGKRKRRQRQEEYWLLLLRLKLINSDIFIIQTTFGHSYSSRILWVFQKNHC